MEQTVIFETYTPFILAFAKYPIIFVHKSWQTETGSHVNLALTTARLNLLVKKLRQEVKITNLYQIG